jgi:hypothetical protein
MTALDVLAPHLARVESARAALDAHNRNPNAQPLDGLALAGRTIRHLETALGHAIEALRYADPCAADTETLEIQGRINRLHALGNEVSHAHA